MTDGERLVWASSYAIIFDRAGDPIVAAQAAARAVSQLREAATRRITDVDVDARDFLDEIVSVP